MRQTETRSETERHWDILGMTTLTVATADFTATAEGMLFLEGGPPHELGAHPCCFREGRISGVALEDRNGGR